jgi:hypothetical protein
MAIKRADISEMIKTDMAGRELLLRLNFHSLTTSLSMRKEMFSERREIPEFAGCSMSRRIS